MKKYDVIVVGGGLAGLTAAIHLSKQGYSVLLIEKKEYPHHKVCGEYVSNEVIPYLETLGLVIETLKPKVIDTFVLSSSSGNSVQTKLPLGGFGISRYAFDQALYHRAIAHKVNFLFDTVTAFRFEADRFEVLTETNSKQYARIVIGAYGKRSALDKDLKRSFTDRKSSWLAVKSHYQYDAFPENQVALHNFTGGYGGLSKTETDAVNFCYLASYESFRKERNIANFNANVVAKNPFLASFLSDAKPIFQEPLTIAQIAFHQKTAVENHILMCGDTAGLIHPLCGNGMAMAIHSAKIASEGIVEYLKSTDRNRTQLEFDYTKKWNRTFSRRLWTGRNLQSLLLHEKLSALAVQTAIKSPVLLRALIKNTHGKQV